MEKLRNPSCSLCALSSADNHTICVMGSGPSSRVMIIGEAPGLNEDLTGLPFQGKAGRLLNEAISAAGWAREDCYVTNCVKCRPPGNRTPSDEEIETCAKEYLIKEIKELDPSFIILLGNTALRTCTLLEKISKVRGEIKHYDHFFKPEALVFATYHPSAALRAKTVKDDLNGDILSFFQRITRALEEEKSLRLNQ